MNEEPKEYLNYIVHLLHQFGQQKEEIHPILAEVFEAGRTGSLCVPMRKEWEKTLKKNSIPFAFETIDGVQHVYLERVHSLKRRLETSLKKQISQKNTIKVDYDKIKKIQRELELNYSLARNMDYKLNEGQSLAIYQTLVSNFQVISGGPGTGKTTVVAFLLRIMKELGHLPDPTDIALVAPTGRAAQRLTESIQSNLKLMGAEQEFSNLFHGQTVHSLLSFKKGEGKFYYDRERALPYRLILVDEVSMMDLDLMVSLFDALENVETEGEYPFHIILLGDPNQLPSVEKGEVLADFLSELPKHGSFLSRLTESNRHANVPQIYNLMKSIYPDLSDPAIGQLTPNFHVVSNYKEAEVAKDEVLWLNLSKSSSIQSSRDLLVDDLWKYHFVPQMRNVHNWKFVSEMHLKQFPSETFILELNRFRCLTILRSGYFGIEGIQSQIQKLALAYFKNNTHLAGDTIQFRDLASRLYYEGMPIIITKNDRNRKLFNGDVGFICLIGNELRAVFCINHLLFSFAIDTLPDHEAAFFMTVHKSQGSEYDIVLFYLPENNPMIKNNLLNKKIIYTAVTRAKKKVILACDKKSWETGLLNDPKRITGFSIS